MTFSFDNIIAAALWVTCYVDYFLFCMFDFYFSLIIICFINSNPTDSKKEMGKKGIWLKEIQREIEDINRTQKVLASPLLQEEPWKHRRASTALTILRQIQGKFIHLFRIQNFSFPFIEGWFWFPGFMFSYFLLKWYSSWIHFMIFSHSMINWGNRFLVSDQKKSTLTIKAVKVKGIINIG